MTHFLTVTACFIGTSAPAPLNLAEKALYKSIIIIIGSTDAWMPRVKNKKFSWAANRNQPQYRLRFVETITQQFTQKKKVKMIS